MAYSIPLNRLDNNHNNLKYIKIFKESEDIEKSYNPENVIIRKVKKSDIDSITELFNSISDEDKKFLAYNNKASLIKQIIKTERHCYVAVYNNNIVGFLRESGRPEGFSLLEEIVVLPEYRGKRIATKLLDYYHKEFNKNLAKTNASNKKMIKLLRKYEERAWHI